MKQPGISPDRPLDPIAVEVLRAVDAVAQTLAIDYFVAGAMARDILFKHVLGFDPELFLATLDIDLAVCVSSWEQFDVLKTRLIESGEFSLGRGGAQRLFYSGMYPVDLVPFGGVAARDGSVGWPPERDIVMNVTGHDDVLKSAVSIAVAPDLVIPVSSPAGLAMLKIFAWLDRGATTHDKDARDLALLFSLYISTIDPVDLYGRESDTLEAVDHEHERASVRLLGSHIRRMASPATMTALLDGLENPPVRRRLTIAIARALVAPGSAGRSVRTARDPVGLADQLLGDFMAGLSSVTP